MEEWCGDCDIYGAKEVREAEMYRIAESELWLAKGEMGAWTGSQ
jgi:uncharacterized membrane protein YsdA (DUF1294 family)